MKAFVSLPTVLCPKCKMGMRYLAVPYDVGATTKIDLTCHCDSIVYSMDVPAVTLEPVTGKI